MIHLFGKDVLGRTSTIVSDRDGLVIKSTLPVKKKRPSVHERPIQDVFDSKNGFEQSTFRTQQSCMRLSLFIEFSQGLFQIGQSISHGALGGIQGNTQFLGYFPETHPGQFS